MEIRTAVMATTTSSSSKVNARAYRDKHHLQKGRGGRNGLTEMNSAWQIVDLRTRLTVWEMSAPRSAEHSM
jgi:hypothetical protein